MASPTSFSFPYISAASMCRNRFQGGVTASTASAVLIWNTPKLNWGIDLPSSSNISGRRSRRNLSSGDGIRLR